MAAVITVDEIKKEIDKVPAEKLESLYLYVRGLTEIRPQKQTRERFIENMNKIQIEAPSDFSANIDDYLYGDKSID